MHMWDTCETLAPTMLRCIVKLQWEKVLVGTLQTCESCTSVSMQGWLQVEHAHFYVRCLDSKLQQGNAHHVAL